MDITFFVRHRQEVSRLEIELESVRDRYKVSNDELSSTNEDRVKLTEKVDDLKQQIIKLQQDRDSSHRALVKQVCNCFIIIIYSKLRTETFLPASFPFVPCSNNAFSTIATFMQITYKLASTTHANWPIQPNS